MTEEKKIPQDAEIVSGSVQKNALRYSGFWVRLAAYIIDGFIIAMITGFVSVILFFFMSLIPFFYGAHFVGVFVGVAIAWTYYIVMTDRFQATLGKMAVGVKVVALDGEKLDTGHIALRETLGKILSRIILNIGFVMVAFTKKKQGLHDLVGKSVVVYTDPVQGPRKPVVAAVFVIMGILFTAFLFLFGMFFALIWAFVMYGLQEGGENVQFNDLDSAGEYHIDEDLVNDHIRDILEEQINIDHSMIEQL